MRPDFAHSYEIYVAASERSVAMALRFLDQFLPERSPTRADYWMPEFKDPPDVEFENAVDAMHWLIDHPKEGYSMAWHRDGEGEPATAFVVFTEDDQMIVGLVTHNQDLLSPLMRRMMLLVGGQYGYVTEEDRPPEAFEDFISQSRTASEYWPRIFDGKFYSANEPGP